MNLIVLTDNDRQPDDTYLINDHRADHITDILRLETGDTVAVGLVNGPVGKASVSIEADRRVRLECSGWTDPDRPPFEVDIICALPRPQTLKKVLFTCGMMGVRRLFLIRANRVEKSYYHSPLHEPGNYQPFLLEGMSQGRNTGLPEVSLHQRFKPFMEDTLPSIIDSSSDLVRLLPDQDAKKLLTDVIRKLQSGVVVAIGPEGGWVPFEVETFESLGFERIALGPWTLRVEHAVTAVLSQLALVK